MDNDNKPIAIPDPWQNLKPFTPARIALGHSGSSLPTRGHLEFQLAHAQARDAVNLPLDFDKLEHHLNQLGYPPLTLQTQAENQGMFLQRPDLGRLLNESALACLNKHPLSQADAVVIVADGLSSKAIEQHAEPFLILLLPELQLRSYRLPPVCLIQHGRVAVGDVIAEHYAAEFCIVLIGERPGLSSPDSMGIYFTYRARAGISTDADRNCISNIHQNGLGYQQALRKLLYLMDESTNLKLSGVHLKDESKGPETFNPGRIANFLLD